MVFLVIGGAGYIGTNVTNLLSNDQDNKVIVYDINILDVARIEKKNVTYSKGDCKDEKLLTTLMQQNKVDVVMHLAASIQVGESCSEPLKYYENNLYGTLVVLKSMRNAGVNKIIFSSTAAVYGQHQDIFNEQSQLKPINPYGASKLACEELIRYSQSAYGINCVILRYFNVSGAGGDQNQFGIWNKATSLLIPKINQAIMSQTSIKVFGNDYQESGDGTCVRDYIHVTDIANAHLCGVQWLMQNKGVETFNVSSGEGYSVLQCIREAERILGKKANIDFAANRPGDPPKLIGDNSKIKNILHWKQTKNLSDMIISDYFFRKNVLK